MTIECAEVSLTGDREDDQNRAAVAAAEVAAAEVAALLVAASGQRP